MNHSILLGVKSNLDAILIGLHDKDQEGYFEWSDGSEFDSSIAEWEGGQPDNRDYRDLCTLFTVGLNKF